MDEEENMHNDPSNWKWGIFYFNPKDKRIFVPKRSLFGLTINFANPNAILIVAVIVFLIVLAARSSR